MNRGRRFDYLVLFGLWLFATAMNLNKAYHIDDTVHLETAQWILNNPWRPMSGLINWDQNADPIHTLNQPHLYFYLLAAYGSLFGFSELSTHSFQSVFTFLCIWLIYLIARIVAPKRALFITVLLGSSPAFVVGQNLMVDVPLLSFWLAFYYVLIKPGVRSEAQRFVVAGLLAGGACLVKYSSLPLVLVMLIAIILKRRFTLLWTLLIPLGMLMAWSLFNYLDYGSIHILDRPTQPFSARLILGMGAAWLVGLGSIFAYSPLFFGNLWRPKQKLHRFVNLSLILVILSSVLVFAGAYTGQLDDAFLYQLLAALFLGNGISISFLLLHKFKKNLGVILAEKNHTILILYFWVAFGTLFIIFFSPFVATRHLLLVIVPITMILAHYINTDRSALWSATSLLLSVFLTLSLGISDRHWANYYRSQAALIKSELPSEARVYFSGHWGWQWYAKQNGMLELEGLNPQLQPGDYLVRPNHIHQQRRDKIPANLQLKVLKEYSEPASAFTFFKTDRGRFYSSSFEHLPWVINWHPFDRIVVYQVQARQGGPP